MSQHFPERLQMALMHRRLSQAEAGKRCGMHQQQLSRLLAGGPQQRKEFVPREATLRRLAQGLGVSMEWLKTGNQAAQPTWAAENLTDAAANRRWYLQRLKKNRSYSKHTLIEGEQPSIEIRMTFSELCRLIAVLKRLGINEQLRKAMLRQAASKLGEPESADDFDALEDDIADADSLPGLSAIPHNLLNPDPREVHNMMSQILNTGKSGFELHEKARDAVIRKKMASVQQLNADGLERQADLPVT